MLTCPNCNEFEFKIEDGNLVCLNCDMVGQIEDNPTIEWRWEDGKITNIEGLKIGFMDEKNVKPPILYFIGHPNYWNTSNFEELSNELSDRLGLPKKEVEETLERKDFPKQIPNQGSNTEEEIEEVKLFSEIKKECSLVMEKGISLGGGVGEIDRCGRFPTSRVPCQPEKCPEMGKVMS